MKTGRSKWFYSRSIAWIVVLVLVLSPLQTWANTTISLKIGEEYSGFTLVDKEYVGEIDSEVMIFQHIKSGARLIHVHNDDTNKVFSINFRTPPSDDTGIPHVLEHALLNGSKNFPLKSPFAEMLKRSLSTFLNALTYADRTAYPVASRNSKDFQNLMHVYLDAVFYPNILEEEKIFMQEGWSYALNSIDDELVYNGVVYNEMKGNFSNPITVLLSEIQKSLLPNTPYAYNSGGDPEVIPTLTYEGLVSFYKQYYHPSNSYIYLYGNLDTLATLSFIDKEYLSNFEKKEIDSTISRQQPFKERVYKTLQYSLPEGANARNRSYLSLNFVVDDVKNKETMLGFQILNAILMQTQASPLRNTLLQAGLGTNFYGVYNPMQLQPSYGIVVENAVDERISQFESIVENTLKNLVTNGIDRDLIDSVFRTIEISLRTEKSNANRGLAYNDNAMLGWLYDYEPTLYLSLEDTVQGIKGKINEGFFENLIQTYLLDNTHSSLIVMEAVPGLDAKKTQALKAELSQVKSSLSKEELQGLVNQTRELREWKESPDSKEALKTLPTLSLEDLQDKTSMNDTKAIIEEHDSFTLVISPLYTNRIAYINLYFDTTKVPQDQIPYIALLSSLLGKFDTASYDFMQLANHMNKNLGGISYQPAAFGNIKDYKSYQPKLVLSLYTVVDYVEDALSLVQEVILNTKFEDLTRLQQLVTQTKAGIENNLGSNGLSIATSQLGRRFSDDMEYLTRINGLDYYYFLKEVEELLASNPKVIVDNLYEAMNLVFQKENLIVGITLDEEEIESMKSPLQSFVSHLKKVGSSRQDYSFTKENVNQGIINGEKIQYVAQGYNFRELGYEYNGSMDVLSQILSMEYLWNNVRVRGGAYGGFANISNTGQFILVSYRDPNLKETLDAYKDIPTFLRNFDADEEKMLNFIIGTLGQYDPLIGPQQKGSMAERFFIANIEDGYIDKVREEILNTTSQDIREFAKLIEEIIEKNNYTVVGNETKLAENIHLFDDMLNIFGAGRTVPYHPARQVFEHFGADVTWDASDVNQPMVIVEAGHLKMVLYVNTPIITINGQGHQMQAPTELRESTTYVPEEAIEIFIYLIQQMQQ